MKFEIKAVEYHTRGAFRISRSSVNAVHVVQVSLHQDNATGRGECRPYPRYNETPESVISALEAVRHHIESQNIEIALETFSNGGAARNALESAWVDWQAKSCGISGADVLNIQAPSPRQTAYTLSWGSVEDMRAAALAAAQYPWLKIKIGEGGLEHALAVAHARPDAQLIIDANEALTADKLPQFLDTLSGLNIALIEQPLPAGHTDELPKTDLIICSDEGLHSIHDLQRLWNQGYRAVNVKLDKCGGPIQARDLIGTARAMGFQVMAGCMVGSSLAMAPMMTLESLCDVIDLDGPLLLADDIENGLKYEGAVVYPPSKSLWG